MSIFVERHQRDDMYALKTYGEAIDPKFLEGKRLGKMDTPHIYFVGGELVPTSILKARNNRKIGLFKGKTFRYGPCHSHDAEHSCHMLEIMADAPRTSIHRFRTRVKEFQKVRRASRDR